MGMQTSGAAAKTTSCRLWSRSRIPQAGGSATHALSRLSFRVSQRARYLLRDRRNLRQYGATSPRSRLGRREGYIADGTSGPSGADWITEALTTVRISDAQQIRLPVWQGHTTKGCLVVC